MARAVGVSAGDAVACTGAGGRLAKLQPDKPISAYERASAINGSIRINLRLPLLILCVASIIDQPAHTGSRSVAQRVDYIIPEGRPNAESPLLLASSASLGYNRAVIATFFAVLAILWVLAGVVVWRFQPTRRWSLDLLATGLYIPATLGFFWQLAFLPDVMAPKGGGDLASFLYPVFSYAASQWQQGSVPLWNPHLYGGSPFLADMQTGSFYPPNLLAFLLARPFTYETMELLAILHYLMAAVFTYIYGRTLGLGRVGAYTFGLVFAFGGFMVAHFGHLNMIEATVWLPICLACFHRALASDGWRWALGSGACVGLSLLAGHNQISLYLALFLCLYWLWGLWMGRKVAAPGYVMGFSRVALVALPLTGLVALGVAAVQLLPTAELLPLTVRSAISYRQAAEYASAPATLVMLLAPHFFGSSPTNFWGISGNLTEVYGYTGVSSLALALVGIVLVRRRSPWLPFFGMAALLFLLLSFGENTILHGWLYRFLPGFDKIRAAGRFVVFFDFGVALLAGFGLEALLGPLAARARPAWLWVTRSLGVLLGAGALVAAPLLYHALLVSLDKDPGIVRAVQEAQQSLNLSLVFLALTIAVLLLWRYLPRQRAWLAPAAIAIIIVDLFSANARYNTTGEDILANYQHPEAIQYLRQEAAGYRIDTQTDVGDVWQPNLSMLAGIDDVMGIYNPMLLADYWTYWQNKPSRSVPAYDLLNVKFIAGHKGVPLDQAKFELAFDGDPQVSIFRNRTALPRAMLAPGAEVMSRDAILSRLKAPDFDPRRTVLLENGEPLAGTGAAGQIIAFRQINGNETVVEARTVAPSYLLEAEAWYPGWKALVDGAERPILRADYTFRAVRLDPGQHTVRFVFQPRSFTIGLGITALTLAAILLALLVRRRWVPGQRTLPTG
jgi:hypothetical protein